MPKNSTKRNRAQKKTTRQKPNIGRAALRAKLARDISAIMQNPETPRDLYNAVGEIVCEWSTDYCNSVSDTAPYIEACLTAYLKKEAERTKGGAR